MNKNIIYNAGDTQGYSISLTLFLIIINDIPDGISSQRGIHADDSTISSYVR